MSDDAKTLDPATQYAVDVVAGKYVVGRFVRLACERHLRDLETGAARGLVFDVAAADRAYRFFGLLRFSKGKWGGKPFVLQGWQQFFVGLIFGWKMADTGLRRFREAHLEVARKNGKTELAAGIAAYLTIADGEFGAEVYCLATKRDQARTTFEVAKKLLSNAVFKPLVRRMKAEIRHESNGSKMEPLGADADTLDSLNVHGAIKDELHAWKFRELWDVIDTATGARSQPLGVSTTTAGWNRKSIWWERRELAIRLLERKEGYDNDEFFPLIFTLDEGDDWEDESTWAKGNPSLGVTLRLEELRKRANEAKQTPGQVNAFKRLRLNIVTENATRWLSLKAWKRAAEPLSLEELLGRPCFGGLDLSLTTDLTAWALIFPPVEGDPKYRLYVRHWIPKEGLDLKEARDAAPYSKWADGERLALSEGDWVDYAIIEARIKEDAEKFRILGVAYDPRFAPSIVQRLIAEGIKCIPWGQHHGSLNTGTKEFHRLILCGEMVHQGCPLLEYQAENVSVSINSAGYQKPDKKQSSRRIDGIAASVNGLSLAIEQHGTEPQEAGMFEIEIGV